MLAVIAITMMMSVMVLAREMRLKYVDPMPPSLLPGRRRVRAPGRPPSRTRSSPRSPAGVADGRLFVIAMTVVVLLLAANTAFNGFPVLGSILARRSAASAPGDTANTTTGW